MISAKNRAFKIQIRERTTHKKMAKVRLDYWLKDNPTYEQLLDQLMILVAHCKFSSQKINIEAFQKIIYLVQQHQFDWNAYLLIYHQIEELNLISMACMKCVPDQDLFYLSKLLFLNKQYLRIDREDEKELFVESRQNCLQKCQGSLFTNIVHNLTSFLFEANKNNFSINENQIQYSNDRIYLLQEISKKVESLDYNLKQQFPFSESEYAALICQICSFLSNNIQIRSVALNSYFNILIFLMSSLKDQNGQESPIFLQLRQTVSEMLLSFEEFNDKKNNWEDHMFSPSTLAKLLQFCKLDSINFIPFVNICLMQGISEKFDPYEKQSIHRQCLQLLLHISYEQKWICYSYFQPFFKIMVEKIECCDKKMNQNFKSNIFNTKIEDQVFKYERADQHYEICIIKIIENLMFNEHEHKCEYDTDSFLSILIQDLIDLNILSKWSQSIKLVQKLQNLVLQLLETENEDHRKYLLNVFHVWISFYNVDQKVKKKIYDLIQQQQKSNDQYLEHHEKYENVCKFQYQMFNSTFDGCSEDYDDLDF